MTWIDAGGLADILEFLDNAARQSAQIDDLARLRLRTDSGEREDIIERAGNILDSVCERRALPFIGMAFDPHAQCSKGCLEIMANRAEHDILFIEQRSNAGFHLVVRCDQPLHIGRAAFGQALWPVGLARKITEPRCEHSKWASDPAQHEEEERKQDDEDHCGLQQDRNNPAALRAGFGQADREPFSPARALDRCHDQSQIPPVAKARPVKSVHD